MAVTETNNRLPELAQLKYRYHHKLALKTLLYYYDIVDTVGDSGPGSQACLDLNPQASHPTP